MGSAKLDQLREKTDQDLLKLATATIEQGFRADSPARAEQAYREASRLLYAIYDLPDAKRSHLEADLARLRDLFESVIV